MTHLQLLDLSSSKASWVNREDYAQQVNRFTGGIPPWIATLPLHALKLRDSGLDGHIPPELGQIQTLGFLQLDTNQLTGSIPPELGSLSSLSKMYVSNNQLTGPVPSELGNLSNLTTLSLANNQFNTPIPPNWEISASY